MAEIDAACTGAGRLNNATNGASANTPGTGNAKSRDTCAHNPRSVCERIAAERKRLGWSFDRLGVEADLSNSCIRHLERQRSTPTLVTLLKLTDALEMDLADLLRDARKTAVRKQ